MATGWKWRIRIDPARLLSDLKLFGLILAWAQEFNRRKAHPFYAYQPDDHPERDQLAFHKSTALTRVVFGGNQSGKSRCVAQEIAWWLTGMHPFQDVPPAPHIFVLSASYRTIQEGIYRHLKEILPDWLVEKPGPLIQGGWQMPSWIQMKSGAKVDFVSGEGREDARRKVQAAEINLVVVDEEIDEILWTELKARRLASGGGAIVAATLVRCEEWCLELEERAEQGDPEVDLVRLSTYVARDRGHVSGRVLTDMESGLTDTEADVRLRGASRKYEGKIYPEFGREHICKPFKIPPEWTRYSAFDPGWRTFAVLWAAVDPEGNYYLYREIYKHGAHYKDVARAWFAASGYKHDEKADRWYPIQDHPDRVSTVWIDPSAFGRYETGEVRVGLLFSQLGIPVAPARNDVDAGIEVCRASLLPGISGVPRMRVFDTCENFLDEIRRYRRTRDDGGTSKDERKDRPVKRRDHLLDCWRYLELGGLAYRQPIDPLLRRVRDEDFNFPVRIATPLGERLEEAHREIVRKQKYPDLAEVEHIGGLGTEY